MHDLTFKDDTEKKNNTIEEEEFDNYIRPTPIPEHHTEDFSDKKSEKLKKELIE